MELYLAMTLAIIMLARGVGCTERETAHGHVQHQANQGNKIRHL